VYERLGHLVPNGSAPDEERVATLVEKLETKLAAYEVILGKQKYLAGDDLTLADLFHLPWGAFAAPQEFTWFVDKEKYPNLSRYVILGAYSRVCDANRAQVVGRHQLAEVMERSTAPGAHVVANVWGHDEAAIADLSLNRRTGRVPVTTSILYHRTCTCRILRLVIMRTLQRT
jgi:hypothetical protein